MIAEEYNFWRTSKAKFMVRLIATIFVICLAIAGVCGWMIYHQKTNQIPTEANQPPDSAAAALNSQPDSTNTTASSLSPLPPASNSD